MLGSQAADISRLPHRKVDRLVIDMSSVIAAIGNWRSNHLPKWEGGAPPLCSNTTTRAEHRTGDTSAKAK